MMKRISVLTLVAVLLLTLFGCDKAPETTAPGVKPGDAITAAKAPAATPSAALMLMATWSMAAIPL